MKKLKELRELRKLTQLQLAKKAGISQSTIHYIETGQKSPTLKMLKKLAKALGVPVSALLEDTA